MNKNYLFRKERKVLDQPRLEESENRNVHGALCKTYKLILSQEVSLPSICDPSRIGPASPAIEVQSS